MYLVLLQSATSLLLAMVDPCRGHRIFDVTLNHLSLGILLRQVFVSLPRGRRSPIPLRCYRRHMINRLAFRQSW